ncbi:MAG TPA: nuclear transport factor 2 family protein [Polyangia bacterium]|nr:nuclear transport factor 2 family protein [Polyangia bacterium]
MNESTDETTIRSLIEDWAAAVRRKDLAGILRDHSADIVMFDVPPPFESRGIAAYEVSWGVFFRWARTPVMFDIRRLEIVAGAEVAFAVALMRCDGGEPGSTASELDFRLTVGLRKIGGRWTIVHEHHSIPAES